jgi:HI0933-like protein
MERAAALCFAAPALPAHRAANLVAPRADARTPPPRRVGRRPHSCSAAPRTASLRPGGGERASVVVIGAGPAGYFTAITVARATRHLPGCSVTILEATRKVLQKVRISGGGRCNCTNAAAADTFAAGYPVGRGRTEMLSPLAGWSAADTRAWFEAEGVPLKVEPSGKVFPVSDSSESIVAALERAASEAGVAVRTGVRVDGLARREGGDGFRVRVRDGRDCECDLVCVATGSSRDGHAWAKQLGHEIVEPVPSLFTFKVRDERLDGLAGAFPGALRRQCQAGAVRVERPLPASGTNGVSSARACVRVCVCVQVSPFPTPRCDSACRRRPVRRRRRGTSAGGAARPAAPATSCSAARCS